MTVPESHSQKMADWFLCRHPVAVRCWMMSDCGTLMDVINIILFTALREIQLNTVKHALIGTMLLRAVRVTTWPWSLSLKTTQIAWKEVAGLDSNELLARGGLGREAWIQTTEIGRQRSPSSKTVSYTMKFVRVFFLEIAPRSILLFARLTTWW